MQRESIKYKSSLFIDKVGVTQVESCFEGVNSPVIL
jgi:hypothetical protein